MGDPLEMANYWVESLASACKSGYVKAFVGLFLKNGWLRDNLVFTWNHRTLHGHESIASYVQDGLSKANITDVKLDCDSGISPAFSHGVLEAALTFETPIAYGRGFVMLQPHQETSKALSLYLTLTDLKGHEEVGPESGYYANHTKTWNETYAERKARIENDPYVLIIGAGQSGLQMGARFKQMNIPTLLIEKTDAVGDVWRMRYPTLTLHTPKSHHTLLYTQPASNAPKFTSRDKAAAMLEQYAYNQDLVVWTRSTMLPMPKYDPVEGRWTVQINRDGVQTTLRPFHILLATGLFGKPFIPHLPNEGQFTGEILHASHFKGSEFYAGKNVVVIGASQTAADICQDLAAHDASSVTMIQRSSTTIATVEYICETGLDVIWPLNQDGSIGDFRAAAMPLLLFKQIGIASQQERSDVHKELWEELTKAGMKLNDGPDGAGLQFKVFQRGGGYWLDVGAADLVIRGKIKVKSGMEPQSFSSTGLTLKDGSTLDADAVIFATGYVPMKETASEIFGIDIATKITPVWGLNDEGEINKSCVPSGHPGLWWAIGDFYFTRYHSKSLALQIKARELKLVHDSTL